MDWHALAAGALASAITMVILRRAARRKRLRKTIDESMAFQQAICRARREESKLRK